jgi:hypothetical protein
VARSAGGAPARNVDADRRLGSGAAWSRHDRGVMRREMSRLREHPVAGAGDGVGASLVLCAVDPGPVVGRFWPSVNVERPTARTTFDKGQVPPGLFLGATVPRTLRPRRAAWRFPASGASGAAGRNRPEASEPDPLVAGTDTA